MRTKLNGKFLMKSVVLILCLLTLVFTAAAQKRKPVRKPTTTPTPSASTIAVAADIRSGAEKVSIQLKNVSRFIYILGGVANNIEAIDSDIRAKKITRKETIDQNVKNKQSVVQSIQNLRAGLAALEVEFRTKPALKIYNLQIQGITDLAASAENQATGGQLTQSGKTLLFIVEKLSDALVALP
jgi:hypothetical protein